MSFVRRKLISRTQRQCKRSFRVTSQVVCLCGCCFLHAEVTRNVEGGPPKTRISLHEPALPVRGLSRKNPVREREDRYVTVPGFETPGGIARSNLSKPICRYTCVSYWKAHKNAFRTVLVMKNRHKKFQPEKSSRERVCKRSRSGIYGSIDWSHLVRTVADVVCPCVLFRTRNVNFVTHACHVLSHAFSRVAQLRPSWDG